MLLFAHKVMLALPGLVKRPGSNNLVWVSHTFSIYGGLRKIRTCGLACRLGRFARKQVPPAPARPLRPNVRVWYTMRSQTQPIFRRHENRVSHFHVTPCFRVGATGFEPATSASRTQRSTKLSHAPFYAFLKTQNISY